jgi:translation initiation factor IF-3
VGVYSIEEAIKIATLQGLDLVEISPSAELPVCKVIDYSKFKYEQKKRQKAIKAKVQKTVLKEIRFGPNTGEHDFNFKVNHALKFLGDGAKVKVFIYFKGRIIVLKERGELLLLRFAQALEAHGKIEQLPAMEGRYMVLTISPKTKK